ncbi:MAG: LacI family DNA-binding transcriptional regulator, partial [Lachnospiraceae bacterium]|nr:LacI family DNA-binding transcriptional regulator [Lachnospiraceae bacterium]
MPVTIHDVATEAGVSVSTVSKVLNNKKAISQPTRDRVREAVRKLNYTPNARAVSFARGNTRNIIYLAELKKGSAYSNPHMYDIMCGVFYSL